ncbi:MAG: AAA family ATPase, partial [Mangrovicoccus sp.]|nr:AAA family ATPase [Mangrovicoccus sp.]
MHFTRLRLNGFKSFVDPTELVIADGLTGVVGPNGCGKSNLLEALRWVMGENRASAMRGGGMEDVIFAGAASRPARNFAEVSLNIDNGERRAPAAFNESDLLDITRRITRDAGSAYKVNSKDVRARDVQLLFADASTGAHSPSLVRQGQISELINAKPKARRRILEEAAGISGLYQRRHEAELKLKSSEANLARLDDVLEQLQNQLGQLSRQAKQAARYRAIGADLRASEALLLVLRWQEAAELQDRARAALNDLQSGLGAADRVAQAARQAVEAAEAALPPAREEASIAAAVLQKTLVERDGLRARSDSAQAQIADLQARLGQIDADAERESALDGDARETLDRLRSE